MIATTAPVCSHPPLPIHVVGIAWEQQNAKLMRPYATIVVQVDASGYVIDAKIDDSSGDAAYDALGTKAIKSWTFAPATFGCKAVTGTAEYAVGQFQETTFDDPCNHLAMPLFQAQPEYPDSAVGRVGLLTVATYVSLDPVGRVVDVKVTTSSGFRDVDAAAFRAALQSQYFPRIDDCRPANGVYLSRVTFDPNR